ncbi:MAG: hypothetical protein V2G41_09915 [bacterium JZ-2024 1]
MFQVPKEGILTPTGQRIQAERITYGGFWDRARVGTAISAGAVTQYFLRANSTANLLETNVTTAGRIGTGWFQVHRIGVHYDSGSSTLVKASDLSLLVNGSLLAFVKDGQELFRFPTFMFQGGWGPYGATTTTATDIVTNGVPSNTLAQTLPFPVDLFDTSTFEVDIIYPLAITLSAQVYVWVVLEGIRSVVISG